MKMSEETKRAILEDRKEIARTLYYRSEENEPDDERCDTNAYWLRFGMSIAFELAASRVLTAPIEPSHEGAEE